MKYKKRFISLDILRLIALFFVIAAHYFLNTNFYDQVFDSGIYYFLVLFRELFHASVPIFIIITGYCCIKKAPTKKYYSGIIKPLFITLIATLVCTCYGYSGFANTPLKGDLDLSHVLFQTITLSGAKYSWYMSMYFGLFLLIPFLNILFHVLSKKHQGYLIISLAIIIVLPKVLSFVPFDTAKNYISDDSKTSVILSNFWANFYPILFYYIGGYLRKHGLQIEKKRIVFYLICALALDAGVMYVSSSNTTFAWGPWQDFNGLPCVIVATLFFSLFIPEYKDYYDDSDYQDVKKQLENYDYTPGRLQRIVTLLLKKSSHIIMAAFMVSSIFDDLYYDKSFYVGSILSDIFHYFNSHVWLVFFSSILLAIAINFAYEILRLPIIIKRKIVEFIEIKKYYQSSNIS